MEMKSQLAPIAYNPESIPFHLIEEWKRSGLKLVMTNGCFDLLHRGHIKYLAEAAELGDRLIVGLNSDASTKRIKGSDRPVKDQVNRAEVLAALRMVDLIVLFNEDTPLNLIEKILPDVLVKGGDWPVDKIVGSAIVIKNGGSVHSLSFLDGESSTRFIDSLRKN